MPLEAAAIGLILDQGGARLVIVDRWFTAVMAAAIAASTRKPPVVWVDDFLAESGEPLGEMEYEQFLETGDPAYDWERPDDERSEEHTSEIQSLMRNSYAVFCLKKKQLCATLQ